MTRTERMLYRRRYLLWIVAALLFLGGAVAVAFLQINRAEDRATQLAAEADRRGGAVSTLATDVRTLRAQITAEGGTPAAPDPAAAVDDLPDRVEVPVPIPGPAGPTGPGRRARPARRTRAEGRPGHTGEVGVPGARPDGCGRRAGGGRCGRPGRSYGACWSCRPRGKGRDERYGRPRRCRRAELPGRVHPAATTGRPGWADVPP